MRIRRKAASEALCTETLILEGHGDIHLDVMEVKCGMSATSHDMIEGKALHKSNTLLDNHIRIYWTV